MGNYILQVLLFQLLFLTVYELLLKKETFFSYNRWYLLFTPILAFILPILKFQFLSQVVPANAKLLLPQVLIGNNAPHIETLPTIFLSAENGIAINWWLIIYVLGALFSFALFLKKYKNLNRLSRFRRISEEKDFKIIEVPNSKIAFTFLSTVFLGDQLSENERQQILSHELVHVKQKHSLDLLFFELLRIIFWFNPLIYLYQQRIAGMHEYLADEEVVKITGKKGYYQQLLNTAFNTENISFINQFFSHSLTRLTVFGRTFNIGTSGGQVKKRIVMLQKSKSKSIAKFKYLVLVPLMLIMVTYVSCSEDTLNSKDKTEVTNKDEALRAKYWQEITEMDKNGISHQEIMEKFMAAPPAPGEKMSKEEYYKFSAVIKLMVQNNNKRKIAEGTFTEKDKAYTKKMQESYNRSYEEYLANKKTSVNIEPASSSDDGIAAVPFAIIDQVPIFPGCENLSSNKEQKECMSSKIINFVTTNFKIKDVKPYSEKGINRVIVQFKINKDGNVIDVKSRASSPELANEAKRVINSLPKMKPGKQKGQDVGVIYALPIVFKVAE